MSYDLNKNIIELYNKKFDKIDKRLDNNQVIKLQDKLNSFDKKRDNYIDSFDSLISRMEESYNLKSSKNLEFFIKNNLKRLNIKTGEIKDFTFKDNCFRYLNDFKLDKNNNLSFEEFENGSFLLNQDTIYSYKKISKVSYLEYINKDKKKIFITFTLPNKLFHKYNYEGKKTATYKSADLFEENIIRGLEYINKQIHHYFYKTLKFKIDRFCKKNKIKNKEIKRIDFIKIIEPHRSLDAHFIIPQRKQTTFCKV